jgi:hypothetical protein
VDGKHNDLVLVAFGKLDTIQDNSLPKTLFCKMMQGIESFSDADRFALTATIGIIYELR